MAQNRSNYPLELIVEMARDIEKDRVILCLTPFEDEFCDNVLTDAQNEPEGLTQKQVDVLASIYRKFQQVLENKDDPFLRNHPRES